ncbi:hypothetical protein IWQ49_002741 [Labrenzia sp. EL_126]|nr:hypothetical protein [Labrenzia sp. EL_126]
MKYSAGEGELLFLFIWNSMRSHLNCPWAATETNAAIRLPKSQRSGNGGRQNIFSGMVVVWSAYSIPVRPAPFVVIKVLKV